MQGILVYVSRLLILLAMCVALQSCGSQTPPTPAPPASSPSPGQTVNSDYRLGWDQSAADVVELSKIRYALYADGTRSELTDVSCAIEPTNGTFACNAHLPPMSPGRHRLELASFVVEGDNVLESEKSPGIEVTFAGGVAAPASQRLDRTPDRGGAGSSNRGGITTPPIIVDGLEGVSDLAFAPDGRLFVAAQSGRIRIIRDGRLLAEPALDAPGAVLALAFDPEFDRTHLVYVLYTATSRRGTPSFVVARYREAGDTLADRAVLLDNIPAASPDPAGALRFGLDGKLYVAFDDSGDAQLAGDLASPNGKVLRLNTDGTTPDDQAGASPLYSSAYRSPRGLDWDTESGLLWAVDAGGAGPARLNVVGVTAINGRKRGITKATVSLPPPFEPSALVFFQDSVLIASVDGERLLRGRIDPEERTRIIRTEWLLENMTEGVKALTVGPDGAVYFATARAIGRIPLQ
jgi:aldose sugar dehydrogenase